MKPDKIHHIVLMGDSLSDRGTMDHRRLLGFIPMDGISGLKAKSPRGRFTNGFTWSDDIFVDFANEFGIKQLKKREEGDAPQADHSELFDALIDERSPRHKRARLQSLSDPDRRIEISDDLLDGDKTTKDIVEKSYSLDVNTRFDYEGQPLARCYAEGGLTAHDYAGSLSSSISRFFSRLILSSLVKKRQELLLDDIKLGTTPESKAQTLVVEWSGANDLITVNKRPSHAEVEKAVAARIKNAEELIKHGYKHVVLFNLPDLGLTPRYQKIGGAEQQNASECSAFFNKRLEEECCKLQEKNPDCSFEVFDVAKTFSDVYENPEKYEFDQKKKHTPYTQSSEFKELPDHTSPAPGYMFWDDVHPTAHMHAILANAFYEKYSQEYHFSQPREAPRRKTDEETKKLSEKALVDMFREAYEEKFKSDIKGRLGFLRHSRIDYKDADLETIVRHGLYGDGHRTLSVMKSLGWFDDQKNVLPEIDVLVDTVAKVDAAQVGEVAPLPLHRR